MILDFGRLFSLFHWFQLRPGPPSSLYFVLMGIYAVGLGASAAYFVNVRSRFADNPYRMNVAWRVGLAAGLLCTFGLIFVGLRFWGIPYLSLRFWVYIITIGAVGLGVFLAYFFLRMYPTSLQAFEELQLRQRYLPKPKPKGVGQGRKRRKSTKSR
ncbi:MAG: hypothetical protein Q8P59_07280 [Dehalococcoidia bacterium]|nr:hypothetical protein [Dehalococcoidia bacterium]